MEHGVALLRCCAGTYDWSGALDMDPNPSVLWAITGSIPAAASPSRHRAVLALRGAQLSGYTDKLHTTAQLRAMMAAGFASPSINAASQPAAATTRCTYDVWHTGVRRSVLETPHVRRISPRGSADTLPVQGRVSVREQWLDDGTSNAPSSPLGSSGVGALTAGASAAIDDEISAILPASPQGVPEERPAAAQPQTAALRPTLPAANGPMPQPMLIALITVASLTACACFVILAAWRRRQRKQNRNGMSANDPTSLYETRAASGGRYCARPYELRASNNTPGEVRPSAWSELSRNDVSHTEVQSLDYGETGSDCSFEGHRAILPPSRDSMTADDADA